jgi:hypothetical protein
MEGWTAWGRPSPFSTCGGFGSIFGGYPHFRWGNLVEKRYDFTNSPHYQLSFNYKIYKIDNWDTILLVNLQYGVLMDNLDNSHFTGSSNECGGSDNDAILIKASSINHNGDHLKVQFSQNFNNDAAWGLREIEVSLKMCDTTCNGCNGPNNNQCTSCYSNAHLSSGECSCNNKYFYEDTGTPPTPCTTIVCGKCSRCHIDCETCDGAQSSNCLTCPTPDVKTGNSCFPPSCKKEIFI